MTTTDRKPTRLERFRAHRDEFFKSDSRSPLLPEQQAIFAGLSYYPEDPALRFEASINSEEVSQTPVEVDTSTTERKTFIPAGKVEIEVEGQTFQLLVFREPGRGRYFLPFRDATSGKETYGAGRYMDPQITPKDTLIVDFNYAYSPYCAYGPRWSCPLPPFENWLPVPIRAGEKSFPHPSEELPEEQAGE